MYLDNYVGQLRHVCLSKGNKAELDNLSEHQVLLMDYAREHAEWENIARVIN
ncbi:hypothetical protein QYZ40_26495 [Vibrio parahaemolyticus]|nr:hypothetical protein [Vibrio parahaemolyticus]MDN4735393.1 hypothetical protein [Vibrio parahaemolyticus]